MEAVPRLPMCSLEVKTSSANTEFAPALKKYIAEFYHEDPESYNKEIKEIETLRQSACKVPKDFTGCRILKRYFAQLHCLQSRFPMAEGGAACAAFMWTDIYSGMVFNITDIRYEQACILYNVGSLHSELGASDFRTNAEGMKVACTHFQCAAWAFQHLRDNYPQLKGSDMSHDLLTYFISLMLAQAQECILEKSMLDSRKSSITSKVAAQVVEFYRSSLATLVAGSATSESGCIMEVVGSKLFKHWKKVLEFKIAYYMSIAHLYMGNQAEEQQQMGERVAWYSSALEKHEEATKIAKAIDRDDLNEALAFTLDVIAGKCNAAKKENDFVYHEKVVPTDALPDIKGASLVKGVPFSVTDLDVCGPDIFVRLVPMEAHEASSIYSEEKAKLLRDVACKVDEKNQELAAFMSSLQLDRNALFPKVEKIPQELLEKCAALSVKPNYLQDLKISLTALTDVYHEVENSIKESTDFLRREEEREKLHQDSFGKRTPSLITVELSKEHSKYETAHQRAAESNATLRKALELHMSNLQLLGSLEDLQKALPSITIMDSPNEKNLVKELQLLLDKTEEMRKQRQMLEIQFRESIQNDDITKLLVTRDKNESLQKLFQDQLRKHETIIGYLDQNLSAQDNILRALTNANARYADTRRNIAEVMRRREMMVGSLLASYDAYEDLMLKAQKGLEFYRKLQANVQRLQARVRSVTSVQEEERTQIAEAQLKKANKSIPTPVLAPAIPGSKLKDYLPYMTGRNMPASNESGFPSSSSLGGSTFWSASHNARLSIDDSTMLPTSHQIGQTRINTELTEGSTSYTSPPESMAPMGVRPTPVGSEHTTNFSDSVLAGAMGLHSNAPSKLIEDATGSKNWGYSSFHNYTGRNDPGGYGYSATPNVANTGFNANQNSALANNCTSSQVNSQPYDYAMATGVNPSTTLASSIPNQYSNFPTSNDSYYNSYAGQTTTAVYSNYSQTPATQSYATGGQTSTQSYVTGGQTPATQTYVTGGQISQSYDASGQLNNASYASGGQAATQSYPTGLQKNNQTYTSVGQTSNQLYNGGGQTFTQSYINDLQKPVLAPTESFSTASTTPYQPYQNYYSTSGSEAPSNYNATYEQPVNYNQQDTSNVYGTQSQGYQTIQPANQPPQTKFPDQISSGNNTIQTATPTSYSNVPQQSFDYNTTETHLPKSNTSFAASYSQGYMTGNYYMGGVNQQISEDQTKSYTIQNPALATEYVSPQQVQTSQSGYVSNPAGQMSDYQTGFTNSNIQPQINNSGYQVDPTDQNYQQYYTNSTTDNVSNQQYAQQPQPRNSYQSDFSGMVPLQPMVIKPEIQKPVEVKPAVNITASASEHTVLTGVKPIQKPESIAGSVSSVSSSHSSVTSSPAHLQPSLSSDERDILGVTVTDAPMPKVVVQPEQLEKDKAEENPLYTKDPLLDSVVLERFTAEVDKFKKVVEGLTKKSLNGPTPLDQKWKEITDAQDKESRKYSISVARCYPLQNRVQDIMPYDSNRVEIQSLRNDYINASYVKELVPGFPKYIVTQTPTVVTQTDFWVMIWEQQVEVVACIINATELKGQIYWPTERGQPLTFGPHTLNLQSSKECQFYTESMISIIHNETKMSRMVVHLQFLTWPTGGIPANPAFLLQFIGEVHNYHRQQRNLQRPIVVHCLSGVGRSGVFCLLSAAMKELALGRNPPDLSLLATKANNQRKFLIQEKEQFKFSYEAALYHAQDILVKRGILSNKTTFDEIPNVRTHVRHPSQDFILGGLIPKIDKPVGAETDKPEVTKDIDQGTASTSDNTNISVITASIDNMNLNEITPLPVAIGSSNESVPIVPRKNSNASLVTSILDPANFTLEPSTGKKKFSKESFINPTGLVQQSINVADPLNQLDPLWSLKK